MFCCLFVTVVAPFLLLLLLQVHPSEASCKHIMERAGIDGWKLGRARVSTLHCMQCSHKTSQVMRDMQCSYKTSQVMRGVCRPY